MSLRLRVTIRGAEGPLTTVHDLHPSYTPRIVQLLVDQAITQAQPLKLRLADNTSFELDRSAIAHVDTLAFVDPAVAPDAGDGPEVLA